MALRDDLQPSFTDVEYGNRRRVTRREEFLAKMESVVPWDEWIALIRPVYYTGEKGRKPKPLDMMLRMYLLQVWFGLSDEGVEDAIYDSYAMRSFMGLDFTVEQVPDATTLLHFRHRLEAHGLGEAMLAAQTRLFEEQGWLMRGGTIVDATLIDAPKSTKNRAGERDPEMHQVRKGSQWYFGMKAHVGVDACSGYVHSVTTTSANVHDIVETVNLIRDDDEVVWGDAGYIGVGNRPEIRGDQHLGSVEFRVAPRKKQIEALPRFDQELQRRQAGVRAKIEHVFLIVKRDFGFTKARYRGLAKNTSMLQVLFASANLLMKARAVALAG